jgi:hypothetical protein
MEATNRWRNYYYDTRPSRYFEKSILRRNREKDAKIMRPSRTMLMRSRPRPMMQTQISTLSFSSSSFYSSFYYFPFPRPRRPRRLPSSSRPDSCRPRTCTCSRQCRLWNPWSTDCPRPRRPRILPPSSSWPGEAPAWQPLYKKIIVISVVNKKIKKNKNTRAAIICFYQEFRNKIKSSTVYDFLTPKSTFLNCFSTF